MGLISAIFGTAPEDKAIGVSSKLQLFLNSTDCLYMEAYLLKSTRKVAPALSRTCALRLQSSVQSTNARYFGDAKYRRTKWVRENGDEHSLIQVIKDVKFDSVKIAGRLSIAVAQNYVESWTIDCSSNKYIVTSIELINDMRRSV